MRGSLTDPVITRVTIAPSSASWAADLSGQLFTTPARWGWQAADYPMPAVPAGIDLRHPPAWVQPPRPDVSHLQRIVASARQQLLSSMAWAVVAAVALMFLYTKVEQHYPRRIARDYLIGFVIIMGLYLIRVLRRIGPVSIAARSIREYLRPYHQAVAQDRQRYERLAGTWQDTVRQYEQHRGEAQARREHDAAWLPVRPFAEPTRIDVIGGDSRRHGWASLLVTLGASVLADGQRVTLLDLTGQQVGAGLLNVAHAYGLTTRHLDFPADLAHIGLLDGLSTDGIAECLAYALTERLDGGDLRHERALARDVLQRVAGCLDAPVTFARLAAGIQVLRQAMPGADVLTPAEVGRLAGHVGEVGHDELAVRQMRLMASQLGTLTEVAPRPGARPPLWSDEAMTLFTTPGGRDDRKEVLDRVLVQLARQALPALGGPARFLIVAGADHLGSATLDMLSEHARQAGVRLLVMIAQPRGDIEKSVGTGGAVCFMKMYNHHDAAIAAEFIGRGHTFVVSQVTRQAGSSFTDGGGGSFSAETERGSEAQIGKVRERGKESQLTESRAHTWTGVRNYSLAQNLSHSTATSRVYEFRVEPAELLDMPATAFILADNTGAARRIVMADSNPGICLLDRVALAPPP